MPLCMSGLMHEKSEWSSLSYLRYTALIKPSEAGIWVWIIGERGMRKVGWGGGGGGGMGYIRGM